MAYLMAKALKIVQLVAINVLAVTVAPQLLPLAIAMDVQAIVGTPAPSLGGTQTSFKADPKAPIPVCVGRTLTGGNIVYQKSHGPKNKYLTLVTVFSLGPIQSIDKTYIDKEETTFSGHNAVGDLAGRVWQDTQLGLCPETTQLSTGIGTPPAWDSDSLLSGLSAAMVTLLYDGKGKTTFAQIPRFGWLGHWVLGYDPRADSSYPGGSGTQRWDDETTWAWSENPFVIGLSFAIGWHQNGKRVGGVGMDITSIDLTGFVEGANVCDANGWKIGGSFTTGDDKWGVLKSMLQAGGGEPVREGATLSCIVNTPRMPIATISNDDIIGAATIPACKTRRDRFNGIIPDYRSEDHDFEVVPAGEVRNATYLAEDGDERTKEVNYSLVQCAAGDTPDQVAQLAGYDIANAREADGIVLPAKLRWIGYRAGDCLECDADETGLAGKQLIVQKRSLDPATGAVTLTLRTEDPDKHAWALGLVGVPAPTTDKNTLNDLPDADDWDLAGQASPPKLIFSRPSFDADENRSPVFSFFYRTASGPGDWIAAGTGTVTSTQFEVSDVDYDVAYEGYVSVTTFGQEEEAAVIGPVTIASSAVPPGPTTNTTAAPGAAGELVVDWRNPGSANYDYTRCFYGLTNVFGSATALTPDDAAGALANRSRTFSGIAAATYYVWTQAFSTGGASAAPDQAPGTVTVT